MFTVLTLGGALVEGPSGPLPGRAAHRRRVALLALLAASRTGSLTREKIVGYLWPDQDSRGGRHLLTVSLTALRGVMGADAFLTPGDELSLNPAVVASDVAEFEAALRAGDAARAVELYRGPFLDGFYVSKAPLFEQWAEGERDRLARAYAGALESLAVAAEAAGDPGEAVRWWRGLAAHDPFSPRVALRLMQALDAAGERVAAIRHADVHAAALGDELALPPDAEVAALAARLRAAPATPAPPAADVPAAPPAAVPVEAREERAPGPIPSPPPLVRRPRWAAETVRPRRRPAPPPPPRKLRPGRLARIAALAVGLVALAALAALALRPGAAVRQGATAAAPAPEPWADANRIAVLYFENQSSDPDLDYLAADLTETLIHLLTRVEGLHVVSPNGVRPFRDRPVTPDSLRRALGVGTLVSASLQLSGDSVRLTAHLVDASSGREIAGKVLTMEAGERFSLVNALAEEVAMCLRERLGREFQLRNWSVGTRDPRARDLLLRAEEMRTRGLQAARRPDSVAVLTARRTMDLADSLLAQAAALDPEWVEPSVRRGWLALDRIGVSHVRAKRGWTALAREHAGRALALQPGHPPALELRGTAYWLEADDSLAPGGWQALVGPAEADLRAATRADPSLASAWSTLSEVLRFKPDPVEAEFAARQAYEKDAYLRDVDRVLERLYRVTLLLERPDEASRWCEMGHRRFPGDWRFVQCQLAILAHPSSRSPDPERALGLLDELSRMDPPEKARLAGRPYQPIHRTVRAAVVLARAGDERRARALLARARRDAGDDPSLGLFLAYDEAYLRLVLGEEEAAFRLLDHYVRLRPDLRAYALRDPQFRPLWSNPMYADLAWAWGTAAPAGRVTSPPLRGP